MDEGIESSAPQSNGSSQRGADRGHPEKKSNTLFILKGDDKVEEEVGSHWRKRVVPSPAYSCKTCSHWAFLLRGLDRDLVPVQNSTG